MCGRYALYSNPSAIKKIFSINETFQFAPSYNIAPTQIIPVICELPDHLRVLLPMRWGLIPSWQKQIKTASPLINARFETIDSKPPFRTAIHQRRCLIIADGFYEWAHNGVKQPYYITMRDHKPFGIAGIWERWIGEDKSIDSCTIITLAANNLVSVFHDRMLAILHPGLYGDSS